LDDGRTDTQREEKQNGEGEEKESGVPSGACWTCASGGLRDKVDRARKSLYDSQCLKVQAPELGKWRTSKAAAVGSERAEATGLLDESTVATLGGGGP
jgi:hypothetical protein